MTLLATALTMAAAAFSADRAAAPSSGDAADYRAYLAAYGTCTVRDRHDQAVRIVLSGLDAVDLQRRFNDIFIDKPVEAVFDCHELVIPDGRAYPFTGEPVRMALAEALVKADLSHDTARSFADRAPLRSFQPSDSLDLAHASSAYERNHLQQRHDAQIAQAWLWRLGECVVRREPARSLAWLLSKVDSTEDAADENALVPALGACLPEGQRLTLDKYMLRGTLAVTYYRLAEAPLIAISETVK